MTLVENKIIFTNENCSHAFLGPIIRMSTWYNTLKKKSFVTVEGFEKDYKLDSYIGMGNTSKVYSATHKETGKSYAIKIIKKPEFYRDMEKLKNEIRILRDLSHPNIISLYEVYEEEDTFNLVMEQLNGGTLYDRIISKGIYSEEDAAQFMVTLLRAISFIHKKGIVHRDIKPENIMMVYF